MELSFLAAKVLCLTYLSAGVAALTGKITYSKVIEDFERSPGLAFISGFLALIIGVVLVHYHNHWVRNWTVLITIVGWLSLLKGIMLVAWPQSIAHFKGWYKNTSTWGGIMIVLGLVFGYFGFLS